MRFVLAALVLLTGCQPGPDTNSSASACVLPKTAQVFEQSGDPHGPDGKLLQVWEMPDYPVLWSEASPAGAYQDFRRQIEAKAIEIDPVKLLKAAPTPNNRLVIEHADRWIGPAGCLEKLLTGYQHARVDTFVAPTEFARIVMRSPDNSRLRIYFYTINRDGIGRMSPLAQPADRDRQAGWTMEIVLHPHAFHPGQPELDGLIAPSVADADFAFNQLGAGLKQAWITNGVHTVRIPADAFGLFERKIAPFFKATPPPGRSAFRRARSVRVRRS